MNTLILITAFIITVALLYRLHKRLNKHIKNDGLISNVRDCFRSEGNHANNK